MDDFGFTRLDAERKAPVLYARSIDSTNNALKKLAAQGAPDGTVLWASEQTAGRGRLGRSFLSPEGGLYLSMLWRPDCPPEKTVSLTSCAAVALCRCLEAWPELDVSIKWPNDVLLGGRKLCGILTEGCTTPGGFCVVMGMGVNVNTPEFPPELRDIAASLYLASGRKWDIGAFSARLIESLDAMYALWLKGPEAFLEEYRARCATVGSAVTYTRGDTVYNARAVGIDGDYALIVERGGERETIRFGEVSVRKRTDIS